MDVSQPLCQLLKTGLKTVLKDMAKSGRVIEVGVDFSLSLMSKRGAKTMCM